MSLTINWWTIGRNSEIKPFEIIAVKLELFDLVPCYNLGNCKYFFINISTFEHTFRFYTASICFLLSLIIDYHVVVCIIETCFYIKGDQIRQEFKKPQRNIQLHNLAITIEGHVSFYWTDSLPHFVYVFRILLVNLKKSRLTVFLLDRLHCFTDCLYYHMQKSY